LASLFSSAPSYPKIDDKTTFFENVPKFLTILQTAEARKFDESGSLKRVLRNTGRLVLQFLQGVPVEASQLTELRLGAMSNYDARVPKELRDSITYFLLSFRAAIRARAAELAALSRTMPAVPAGPVGGPTLADLEARLAKLKEGGARSSRRSNRGSRRQTKKHRRHAHRTRHNRRA